MRRLLLGIACVLAVRALPAQDSSRTKADSAAIHYYDGWPGVWYRVSDTGVDSMPTFEVRRGPGHSFLETWHLIVDGSRQTSFGLRAWDPATRSWGLVWVADPDILQIWEGERHADGWYITRRFGEGATSFLSRQAWVMTDSGELLRTIERSTDGGQTRTVRYRDTFRRRRLPAP